MDERTHARYMADIAYFLSKMEAEPNSGYFIPIALAYNKLEKYDETIAMCKTAVERFPSNCAAKTFLAEAYVYKGFFDQARELLFDVTAEDDNNYKALKLLGIICKEKGDNTEALKYLTGAFIRSPEDEEVRKMIDELGGTLNPGQIYDERMKRQSQNAAESEEDEDLKTYQEIDNRIRNAEIIMADLVSDTSINARNYADDEDFHSDDPNDYMPLITQHEDEEESLSGSPDDFLPQINKSEETQEPVETLSFNEEREDLAEALQEENSINEAQENNNTDDLLSALSSEEDASEDLAEALQKENSFNETSEDSDTADLLSVLSSEENASEDLAEALQKENSVNETTEDNDTADLLSVLSSEEDASEDLTEALQKENSVNETTEDNDTADLLSVLSSEEDASEDLTEALQKENSVNETTEDNDTADLLSVLSSEENASKDLAEALQGENSVNETPEYSDTSDLLSVLSSEEDASEDLAEALQEEDALKEIDGTLENTDINSQTATEYEQTAVIEESEEKEDDKELPVFEEQIESNEDTLNKTESSQNIIEEYTAKESVLTADNEIENEDTELLKKQVPSSFVSMTYDDMIDDDFQYGKIVDDSYKDSDNPSIDLGESAPFTQGDIMDEILSAVGMTHDDMADDERINISEKDRKLMRLENFLEKVQHNKESK